MKVGHVYEANKESDFAYSHGKSRAIVAIDDFVRAYTICYGKPTNNGLISSRTYYVDLDRQNITKIVGRSVSPILDLGGLGEFDEHGVMGECVVRRGDELWMYYDGWSRKSSVPYDWSIGLAISRDGGNTYKKHGRGPILGPSPEEPFLFASPFVLPLEGDKWHMWYLGGDGWKLDESGKPYAVYTLKHATSSDGISWARESAPCVKSVLDEECQAGPTVFSMNGVHHMIFSYRSGKRNGSRSQGYRLGHAVSTDLLQWERMDESILIEEKKGAWDSEMMCYPQVVEIDKRVYLFYSGNDYGRAGFGVAELIKGV
jgi:hypothetical protein